MLRGLISGVIIFMLSISFIVFGLSWDLSSSLKYQNMESNAVSAVLAIAGTQINITQEIASSMPMIQRYCSLYHRNVSLNYQGLNITLPCNDANATASKLINDTLKNVISGIYYKEYNCKYIDCFKTVSPPLFVLSQKSQEYWQTVFYYSLFVSLLLAGLLTLASEKKKGLPITIGIVLALASLPILAFEKIFPHLPSLISGVGMIFLSQSNFVFLRMIVVAAALVAIGILLNMIDEGFKLYNFFNRKAKKDQEKEELKKEVEEDLKQKRPPQGNLRNNRPNNSRGKLNRK